MVSSLGQKCTTTGRHHLQLFLLDILQISHFQPSPRLNGLQLRVGVPPYHINASLDAHNAPSSPHRRSKAVVVRLYTFSSPSPRLITLAGRQSTSASLRRSLSFTSTGCRLTRQQQPSTLTPFPTPSSPFPALCGAFAALSTHRLTPPVHCSSSRAHVTLTIVWVAYTGGRTERKAIPTVFRHFSRFLVLLDAATTAHPPPRDPLVRSSERNASRLLVANSAFDPFSSSTDFPLFLCTAAPPFTPRVPLLPYTSHLFYLVLSPFPLFASRSSNDPSETMRLPLLVASLLACALSVHAQLATEVDEVYVPVPRLFVVLGGRERVAPSEWDAGRRQCCGPA
jgi:hypothetical protein